MFSKDAAYGPAGAGGDRLGDAPARSLFPPGPELQETLERQGLSSPQNHKEGKGSKKYKTQHLQEGKSSLSEAILWVMVSTIDFPDNS